MALHLPCLALLWLGISAVADQSTSVQLIRAYSRCGIRTCEGFLTSGTVRVHAELEGLPQELVTRALGVLEKAGRVTCAADPPLHLRASSLTELCRLRYLTVFIMCMPSTCTPCTFSTFSIEMA